MTFSDWTRLNESNFTMSRLQNWRRVSGCQRTCFAPGPAAESSWDTVLRSVKKPGVDRHESRMSVSQKPIVLDREARR